MLVSFRFGVVEISLGFIGVENETFGEVGVVIEVVSCLLGEVGISVHSLLKSTCPSYSFIHSRIESHSNKSFSHSSKYNNLGNCSKLGKGSLSMLVRMI